MNTRRIAAAAALASLAAAAAGDGWLLPINAADRRCWSEVRLTPIGRFGIERRARPKIPAHLHTGVDIRRPRGSGGEEPVFPAAPGVVVSVRDDGPFAQVIVEHRLPDGRGVWSVYEHVAGIAVAPGDTVSPLVPIARFLNLGELDRHGHQFDHLHFEIMRTPPTALPPDPGLPRRRFATRALECHDRALLERHYFDPRALLEARWHEAAGE